MACYDLEAMLIYDKEPPLNERNLAQGVIRKEQQVELIVNDKISHVLQKSCLLAKALMQIGDETGRWELIEGVWVEMLCNSASRCRGYLHAKSLGQGSELLSYVWLLLSHMGMDIFADRFQRLDPPEEDEAFGIGSSWPEHPQEGDTAGVESTSRPQEVPTCQ